MPTTRSLLAGLVIAFLFPGALSTAVGTALGVAHFRDVGFPDSATLLRVGDVVRSGSIYPDSDRPPYLVSLYGPLTYVVLAVPYAMAQAAGISPPVLVRLVIAGALGLCVVFVFLISRRLYTSRPIAWLCALLAISVLPLASWTTQIRGDFLALAMSLLSLHWFLLVNARGRTSGAAISSGMALLVKQTFVAVPVAISVWLIYRRRYWDAVVWATSVAATVAGGYAIVWWREPLMLKHIAALRHPIFEFREATVILWTAVSQPVTALAVIGVVFAAWKRAADTTLVLMYFTVAWLVATLTSPQVGGNINYFWEPLMASAVLAGHGLSELQRRANRLPILAPAVLVVRSVGAFASTLPQELAYLRNSYWSVSDYHARRTKWESFVSAVSGRRLLSTFPDVTVHSMVPEIPDPYLNAVLERRGLWHAGPVVAQMDAGVYDLIVIRKGQADPRKTDRYRGIRVWDDEMWEALTRSYAPACIFEGMEIWLPDRGAHETLPRLSGIGCLAVAR